MDDKQEPELIREEITITSDFKVWGGKDRSGGTSDGTSFSIKYRIPEGLSTAQFSTQIIRKKLQMDLLCISMEYVKGNLQKDEYDRRKQLIEKALVLRSTESEGTGARDGTE